MEGLIWAAVIWVVLLLVSSSSSVRSHLGKGRFRVSREQIAIILVLLGTHSTVASATAEEVLRDPAVLERIVRGALAGLGLIVVLPMILRRHPAGTVGRYGGLTALTAYWGVATLSVLYSVAPIVTIGKAFELGAGMAIVWAIAIQHDAADRLRTNIKFIVFLEAAIVGVAVIGFFAIPETFSYVIPRPGFIFESTMGAPFSASNALSARGALIAAFSLAMFFQTQHRPSRIGWMSLFSIGTIGVILASGRQGVVIWMAAVMVLLWIYRRRLFLLLLAPGSALVITTYGDVIWAAFVRNRAANIVTLSGRVGFWEAAIESWYAHPLTGYGYGAGGRFVALVSIGDNTTSNLHSGYMETLVGLGIIGLVPLALAVWRLSKWSTVRLLRRAQTEFAILLIPLLLHTSVSMGFAAWLNADFLLFALLVTLAGMGPAQRSTDPPEHDDVSVSQRLLPGRRPNHQ